MYFTQSLYILILCLTSAVDNLVAMSFSAPRSKYFSSLDAKCAARYESKIRDIDGEDPYCVPLNELTSDLSNCNAISYLDLVNYLVYTKSFYTAEEFKAYKSLEAFNQFSSGWVRDLRTKKYGVHSLIIAKVLHSQKFNDDPLVPWVIANGEGVVICAHCTCMAGLAETCTHVGALLFFVEYDIRSQEIRTVTQEPAYWPVPAAKEVTYSRIKDIDFTTPKRKCIALEESMGAPQLPITQNRNFKIIPSPTAAEILELNKKIFDTGVKSAFFSVTRGYQQHFKPVPIFNSSANLSYLHNEDLYDKTIDELRQISYSTVITITEEDATKVEKITRERADCKLRFRLRAGRITASKLRAACHVRTPTSSPSLIKSICYPDTIKFKNKVTEWGCKHEKLAKKLYTEMSSRHKKCTVSKVGLILHPKYPFLGASPDALVSCECCGQGVVEIKCPYCIKDKPLCELPEKNCLQTDVVTGKRSLKIGHAYYFQIQSQIFLSQRKYGDFMVWANMGEPHIERIYPDEVFWEDTVAKASTFFREGVLLELLAKVVTRGVLPLKESQGEWERFQENHVRLQEVASTSGDAEDNRQLCLCNGKLDFTELMVKCSSVDCAIQWYHIKCLNLKRVPKGKYLCRSCKPKRVKSTKK